MACDDRAKYCVNVQHIERPVKTGIWTCWYDNGMKRAELCFRAGVKHGAWRFRTREGTLWKEQEIVNGLPEYKTRAWYPDGRPSSGMTCVNGKPDGMRTSWDRKGEVIEETRYRNGTQTKTR